MTHEEEKRKQELETRHQRRGTAGLTPAEHEELKGLRNAQIQHREPFGREPEIKAVPGLNADYGSEHDPGADNGFGGALESAGRDGMETAHSGVREESGQAGGDEEGDGEVSGEREK